MNYVFAELEKISKVTLKTYLLAINETDGEYECVLEFHKVRDNWPQTKIFYS
jgi:hypothetical protein